MVAAGRAEKLSYVENNLVSAERQVLFQLSKASTTT